MSTDTNDPKGTVGIAMIGNGFAAEFHTTNYKRTHGVNARLVGVYGLPVILNPVLTGLRLDGLNLGSDGSGFVLE